MSSSSSLIGQTIKQFHIQRLLGEGGMAQAYRAYDTVLKRSICLKVIRPAMLTKRKLLVRFEREARAMARVEHHNLVKIFDVGTLPNGAPYMVMEYAEGGSLRDYFAKQFLLPQQQMPAIDVLLLIRKVATALTALHEANIVHRDLKPANILLRADGEPVVADLGIAAVEGATKITNTGVAIGTMDYMSPEQAFGQPLDGRSDIYTVGIILFRLLSQYRPSLFDETTLRELRPGLAAATYRLVEKCRQQNAAQRFQTARELVQAIDKALEAERRGSWSLPAQLPTAFWVGVPVVGLLVLVGFLLMQQLVGQPALNQGGSGLEAAMRVAANDSAAIVEMNTPTETAVSPTSSSMLSPSPSSTLAILPTSTIAPTKTPVVIPTFVTAEVVVVTVVPRAVETAVSLPQVCSVGSDARWAAVYDGVREELGCAVGNSRQPRAAAQPYANGLMIWREDRELVYVLFGDGRLSIYSTADAEDGFEQSALLKGAFGYLWVNETAVRNLIGEPFEAEYVPAGFVVQDFSNGVIFQFDNGGLQTYLLFTQTEQWASP